MKWGVRNQLIYATTALFLVVVASQIVQGVLLFTAPIVGQIDGSFNPVVKNFEVMDVVVDADGKGITFTAEYDKVRNCTLIGTVWYKPNGDLLTLTFPPAQGSRPRTLGHQRSEGWHLNLPVGTGIAGEDVLKGTRAEFIHQCLPGIQTITKFYP